jgi:hypothetical protein
MILIVVPVREFHIVIRHRKFSVSRFLGYFFLGKKEGNSMVAARNTLA